MALVASAFASTPTFASTPASAEEPANSTIRINEVESNGGTPGDWVELVNIGAATVDVSGWVVKDNDDTHSYVVASGTAMAAGSFLALDVDPSFGLGAADSARLFASDATTLIDSYSWTAHASTTYGRCPDGVGAFSTTTTSTKGAANDCGSTPPAAVRINEVESNGGAPGDWVELVNTGSAAADVSGWIVRDNDDTHTFTIPAATTLPAGGFLALDVDPVFGLGSADSARLFRPDGVTLVDSYNWTAHASTTYGRCPDGTGDFVATTASTKGAANACPGQTQASPWPGGAAVSAADTANLFGTNMSGLAYQGSDVLWAVKNGPGTLYRLTSDGSVWTPDSNSGWALRYPDGTGDPDSEGVTLTEAGPAGGVFVSTERDNANNGVSRPEILRFDPSGSATSLNATREWNLTADLPPVAANSGLEGISWIPDSFLTGHGFVDEHTGAGYNPEAYPGHGDGLFFVGLEANGLVYAYALDQATGGFTRVATITSGFPGVMDLEFEPETGHLWAVCDDTCEGRLATLDITSGHFGVSNVYERPASMPNLNNEGFAIAPQSACVDGHKPVFWSDDTFDAGHALRGATINCTVLDLDADNDGINDDVDVAYPPGTSQVSNPANNTFSDALIGGSTSGTILNRAGHDLTVSDASNPSGVRVDVGPGAGSASLRLTDNVATVALGPGSYQLTGLATTTTIGVLDGGPAVVTVTVNKVPITMTVATGSVVTYTEVVAANATVAGLTNIRSTGPVGISSDGMATGSCAGIAIGNVIVGGGGNEQLAGTPANDLILGRGGNDTVNGNGGSDCVVTGAGNDAIATADGDDWIDAGGGNNSVTAGSGRNTVTAGSGNDRVTTGDGADMIDAGNGNNSVSAGAGDDVISSGGGNDSVDCGTGSDTAHAGQGNNANAGNRCETFTA